VDGSHLILPYRWIAPTSVLAALSILGAGGAGAADPAPDLRVDLSRPVRQVTHCASGAAWGASRSAPPNEILAALQPTSLLQPATLDGEDADFGALDVAARVSPFGLHHVQAVLSDLLPGHPPRWPGLDDWLALVRAFVERTTRAERDDVWYDLWDELDRQPMEGWRANGQRLAVWKATHDAVREADPQAVIVGPSLPAWERERYGEILAWMRDNTCLPDVVSWQETGDPGGIETHASEYRELLRGLDIDERAILVSQYMGRDDVGAPGPSVAYLAALERARVGYACLALWHAPGTMARLVDERGPLGGLWVYRWYAEMSGQMVSAGPAAAAGDARDALASVDEHRQTASILVAGERPHVVVYGLGATPFLLRAGRVHVRVERAPHDGFGPVRAPELIAERDVAVSEQTFELTIPTRGWDAARIVLSVPR